MNRSKSRSGGSSPSRPQSGPAAPPTQPPLSRRKLWAFRAVAALLVPLLLLGTAELILRIAGYGFRTSFFRPVQIRGTDFLVENDKFGLRFFPAGVARSPAPVVMPPRKPAGTRRIFVLGESAALGDPRPAYGPARYLKALLEERHPELKFDVVCVAMTAINSHAVLPIARECSRYEGDFWIVYLANNEYVGPFGATTVFGAQAPSCRSVRAVLAVQRLRVGQLLMSWIRKLRHDDRQEGWGGMKMFLQNQVPPFDSRRIAVEANFRKNLRDLLDAGQAAHVPILLNTIAVNLRDCPPFASFLNTNLPAADAAAAARLLEQAAAAERTNDVSGVLLACEPALKLEPDTAQLHFLMGLAQARLTNCAPALEHLSQARDLDTLPFRTTARLNAIIREQAGGRETAGITLIDAEGAFAAAAPCGAPGEESFYEHVHFNFDGNYRLALLWAEQLIKFLPATESAAGWPSQSTCERRLALTDWNRAGVYEDMIRRFLEPPFTNQSGQAERLARLRRAVKALATDTAAAQAAREVYQEALQRDPADHRFHENYAEFLEATGDIGGATEQWRQVAGLLPHHHLGYFHTGRLLVRQNRLPEATVQLQHALELRPDLAEGWLELGKIQAIEGKPALALENYERERRLAPGDPRVYYHIGKALSNLNRRAEAIQQLRKAIALNPGYWEAHYALGEELAFSGRISDARTEFEQVIRIQPNYAMAHFNLGVALAAEKKLDEAVREFEETLRLDPNHALAKQYVEKIKRPGKE